MVVLALLLLAAGVGACVVVAIQATDPVTVTLLGQTAHTSARGIFAAGVVAGLLVMAGLWLLKAWSAHARRRHREMRDLERGRNSELQRLEAEKAELETKLRQQQRRPEPAAAERPPRKVVDLTAQERRAAASEPDPAATGSGTTGSGATSL